jgi:hypothetical protein
VRGGGSRRAGLASLAQPQSSVDDSYLILESFITLRVSSLGFQA